MAARSISHRPLPHPPAINQPQDARDNHPTRQPCEQADGWFTLDATIDNANDDAERDEKAARTGLGGSWFVHGFTMTRPELKHQPSRPGTKVPPWDLVNKRFTIVPPLRSRSPELARQLNVMSQRISGELRTVFSMPYVADRATVDIATTLIADLGSSAGQEAAARADANRTQGNVRQFCRWRQIERLILVLSSNTAVTTIN